MRKVIYLVAGHACDMETFHIVCTALAVLIYDIVCGTLVARLEHRHMKYGRVGSNEYFISNPDNLVVAVVVKNYYVVKLGTAAYALQLLFSF